MIDDTLCLEQEEKALETFLAGEDDFIALQTQLSQTMDVALALETHGITNGTVRMLKATQLLNSSSFDAIATESMEGSRKQSQMAMESLGEAIKTKAASFAAKVISIVKDGSAKVLAVLNPLMTTVGGLITKLTSKAWDKTKAAGRTIKAHPVASVMTVVAAIAAVAGIMAYCGSSLPGGSATKEAFESFIKVVNDKIVKIPSFGKRKVEVNKTFTKIQSTTFRVARGSDEWKTLQWETVLTRKSVEELGWTESLVAQLGTKLDDAITATRRGMSAFGTRALNLTSDVGHATFDKASEFRRKAPEFVYKMTGSPEAAHATSFAIGGIYFGLCVSLVYAIWRLVKQIVIGGLKLIGSTLRSLVGAAPMFA